MYNVCSINFANGRFTPLNVAITLAHAALLETARGGRRVLVGGSVANAGYETAKFSEVQDRHVGSILKCVLGIRRCRLRSQLEY